MSLKKIKDILGTFMVILGIMGLVTFSQFIVEESIQTTMFGTWAAQDAKDWKTVKLGSDLIKRQICLLDNITKYVGWVQPLAWISYGEYAKAASYYTTALDAKILAHEPMLFDGEIISMTFHPESFTEDENKFVGINSNIKVIVDKKPNSPNWHVHGKLIVIDNTIIIDGTKGK